MRKNPLTKFVKRAPDRRTGELRVGDHATIIKEPGHDFPVGTEVRLVAFDGDHNKWRCEYLDKHDWWYVHASQLELIDEVTERELRAALKSIEKSARNLRKERRP